MENMKDLARWQKGRAAVERWKAKNRDYYLQQKRQLASRPEYLAHRRAVYQERRQLLKDQGLLPKRGRPRSDGQAMNLS